MKIAKALNFIRSAIAPVMRAGVMIANISWKATNTTYGIAPSLPERSWSAKKSNPPQKPLPAPNATLNPMADQISVTIPMQKKFCMIIPSTFFARTMPP